MTEPGGRIRCPNCGQEIDVKILRVDTIDMTEGSPEEVTLFEATSLSIPDGAATWANRWILIDKTCQVMFTAG